MTLQRFSLSLVGLLVSVLSARPAPAEEVTRAPGMKLLSPDARRFLAPSSFAYWAGTERVLDGELSPAMPRPLDAGKLLPALDDHLSTTAYVRAAHAAVRRRDVDWNLLELGSVHEVRGGASLGANFRVDARERTAVQGIGTLVLPMANRFWLVPTVGVGARSDTAPELVFGVDLRSDREKRLGYAIGVEASRWTLDRTRVVGKAGAIYRVGPTAALEQRLAIGAWDGAGVGGDVAFQSTSAALQTFGDRFALYERVTLSNGLAAPIPSRAQGSALSVDVAIGFRHLFASSYGFVAQVDLGGQQASYQRTGFELTFYGTVF